MAKKAKKEKKPGAKKKAKKAKPVKKAPKPKRPPKPQEPKPAEMLVAATVAASTPTFHVLATRPALTPERVDRIVINNTPSAPSGPVDPDTQLLKLGVVSDELAADLQAGVQSDLNRIGWQIKQDNITATPSTMVSQCRTSVMKNAF